MTAAKDPRWRRAEAIRARILQLLGAALLGTPVAGCTLRACLFGLFPGKPPSQGEVTAALGVLRRQGKVVFRGRRWRLRVETGPDAWAMDEEPGL